MKYQASVIAALFVLIIVICIIIYFKTRPPPEVPSSDNPDFDEEKMYLNEEKPFVVQEDQNQKAQCYPTFNPNQPTDEQNKLKFTNEAFEENPYLGLL